jgi:hypothetical protein
MFSESKLLLGGITAARMLGALFSLRAGFMIF